MQKLLVVIALSAITGVFGQPAGSLDPTFGDEGKVLTSVGAGEDKAYGVALQDDNKILVAGYSYSLDTDNDFVLVRYHEDGSLDESFGDAGIVKTDLQLGSNDLAYDLAIQADGKIIVVGSSDNGTAQDAALVRYNTDGSLDETFGTDGIVLTDFDEDKSDELRVVKIHAITGNIVAGGSAIISDTKSKPVVARYLSSGALDLTFEENGIRLLWIDPLDYQYLFSVEDLVVQGSGKITAVGWRDFPDLSWDSDYWAGRINSDGTMDVTFDEDGVNIYNGAFNGHDRAYGMILNPDNSFYFSGGGYVDDLRYDCTLFEILPGGGTGSDAASADYGTFLDDVSYSFAKDMEGAYIMAGSTGNDTYKDFAIERVTAGFSLDADFSGDGKVTTSFADNDFNEAFDMLVQLDNKIVAVGYSGDDFAIARYLGNDLPQLNDFELVSPDDMAENRNYASLAFNWTNAFGATSYELQIDISPDFDDSPEVYDPVASALTLSDLLPDQEYFWRVRATDGDEWGEYTDTWSFTTNSLENFNLISPSNGATGAELTDLTLDWSTAVGASDYELQLDLNESFTDPDTYTTSGTDYDISGLDVSTTYYWRVRASNDGDSFGEWTAPWSFTTTSDVGIPETTQSGLLIKLYPNPVNEMLNFRADEALLGMTYHILDISGKVVRKGIINQELTTFSFSGEPGYYILQVKERPDLSIEFTRQ